MKTKTISLFRRLVLLATIAAGAAGSLFAQSQTALDHMNPRVREAMAAQDAVTPGLMKVDGILGTATGSDDNGGAAVVIYVNQEHGNAGEIIRALPKSIRGQSVKVELTEPFVSFAKPGGGSAAHKAKQTPPIRLGTSGGWRKDLANGYCCGGTLGSLVNIGGRKHILSNYHVFESDTVNGGNGTYAQTGDPVIQPALIDVGCNANNAQNVATLVVRSALPNANVDCSIAEVAPGMVATNGDILGIGTISAQTAAAALNKPVKKSGRTTGLTRSSISALNATISVAYENECAGGHAFTKTFTGQIVVKNRGNGFLAGGDSGSLMVEDVSTNPRAVGLLYAGSSTTAIANPIQEVLNFLGATMVGN